MVKDSRKLSAKQLEGWLDLLCGTNEGAIRLINVFLSYKHELMGKELLHSFFADCIARGATTPENASDDFEYICATESEYSAQLSADPLAIPKDEVLVNTIKSTIFVQYILNRAKSSTVSSVMPAPKSSDPSDEEDYKESISKATSRMGWYKDKSTLGSPFIYPPSKASFSCPRYVWLSRGSHVDKKCAEDTRVISIATKIRDVLGLVHIMDGVYLLSLSFPAEELHLISGLRMARPSSTDMGNRRFAVYLNKAAEPIYKEMWGVTVHLGRIDDKPRNRINGVPERICSPIQLTDIGSSITVNPLGWVEGSRGATSGIDDDDVYISRLIGRHKLGSIKRNLKGIANHP